MGDSTLAPSMPMEKQRPSQKYVYDAFYYLFKPHDGQTSAHDRQETPYPSQLHEKSKKDGVLSTQPKVEVSLPQALDTAYISQRNIHSENNTAISTLEDLPRPPTPFADPRATSDFHCYNFAPMEKPRRCGNPECYHMNVVTSDGVKSGCSFVVARQYQGSIPRIERFREDVELMREMKEFKKKYPIGPNKEEYLEPQPRPELPSEAMGHKFWPPLFGKDVADEGELEKSIPDESTLGETVHTRDWMDTRVVSYDRQHNAHQAPLDNQAPQSLAPVGNAVPTYPLISLPRPSTAHATSLSAQPHSNAGRNCSSDQFAARTQPVQAGSALLDRRLLSASTREDMPIFHTLPDYQRIGGDTGAFPNQTRVRFSVGTPHRPFPPHREAPVDSSRKQNNQIGNGIYGSVQKSPLPPDGANRSGPGNNHSPP